jgi:hypothetical protein
MLGLLVCAAGRSRRRRDSDDGLDPDEAFVRMVRRRRAARRARRTGWAAAMCFLTAVAVAGAAIVGPTALTAPAAARTAARDDSPVPELLRRVQDLEVRLSAAETRAEHAESLARVASERLERNGRRASVQAHDDDPIPGVVWHRAHARAGAPPRDGVGLVVTTPPAQEGPARSASVPPSLAGPPAASGRVRETPDSPSRLTVVDAVRVAARGGQTTQPSQPSSALQTSLAQPGDALRAVGRATPPPPAAGSGPELGEKLRDDWSVIKREFQAAGTGIGRAVAGLTRKAREALDLD